MNQSASHKSGDQIRINEDVTVTLITRSDGGDVSWNWSFDAGVFGVDTGEDYWTTPEEAIADAIRVYEHGQCRHGVRGWCIDCADETNKE